MMGEDRLERAWCRGEGDVDHTYTATNEYRQLTNAKQSKYNVGVVV